jgi:hypothetical protein
MTVRRLSTDGPWFELQKLTRRFWPTDYVGRKDGTTVSEQLGSMASAETAKRLGPLICNPTTTMGLNNYPMRCDCFEHSHLPRMGGRTHPYGEPCAFKADEFPRGIYGSCCSLRGALAERELRALGKGRMAKRMFKNMTAEQADAFAKQLRNAADCFERKYAGKTDKPKGASWIGCEHSTFEEARPAFARPRFGMRRSRAWGSEWLRQLNHENAGSCPNRS